VKFPKKTREHVVVHVLPAETSPFEWAFNCMPAILCARSFGGHHAAT
jgi:hypothetical protein